ncbi:hypothetical protein H6G93_24855 [Nostoc sp. FACHB-973]|nr:hypothetical protein [Nostoc sp. FACHB-973]
MIFVRVADLTEFAIDRLRHRFVCSEPRVRKRRPKIYPLMTKPRHELRKQLQTA